MLCYHDFFREQKGRKITDRSGELVGTRRLFQKVSVRIQRFSLVLFCETLQDDGDTDT